MIKLSGLDTIYKVDINTGEIKRRIGKCGSGPGELKDPSGIVCDANGYILVGDSLNHRIQVCLFVLFFLQIQKAQC